MTPTPSLPDPTREPATAALEERLRQLDRTMTAGPWASLTHGTASQRDAAGRAYEAVMARRDKDSPDIQFTDLSWVETTPDGPHVAMTGNGPNAPENAHAIADLRNLLPDLIAFFEARAASEARVAEIDVARLAEAIRLWYVKVGRNPTTGNYDQPQASWLIREYALLAPPEPEARK